MFGLNFTFLKVKSFNLKEKLPKNLLSWIFKSIN